MSDPFADLGDALEEAADPDDGAGDRADDPDDARGAGPAPDGPVPDDPAFPFDETKQSPVYARPAAWNALDDALDLDVQRRLREAGVRDVPKRELHDAALRVAAAHPEEVFAAVVEARRSE
jgi:hypothetical protein